MITGAALFLAFGFLFFLATRDWKDAAEAIYEKRAEVTAYNILANIAISGFVGSLFFFIMTSIFGNV